MWTTIGHHHQKTILERALQKKRYAHAYLFCGPAQVGKRTLAVEFANHILGSMGTGFNPDISHHEGATLDIAAVRSLIAELSYKPYQYDRKIAIIDNIEDLGVEAANSILKTLEEPSDSTIIILISKNKSMVLPTIVSRCQVVAFGKLHDEKIATVSIGKARALQADDDQHQQFQADQKFLSELQKYSDALRMSAVKNYAEMETVDLKKTLENWIDIEEQKFLHGQPHKYTTVTALLHARAGLDQNLNKKLLLERLFLDYK